MAKNKAKSNTNTMEVQLLRGKDGKVIFLECGSDFVEVMFKIMKTPLSSLLGVCPTQKEKEQHPLLAMRKSLCELGKQSFVKGDRPDDAVAKAVHVSDIMTPPDGHKGYNDLGNGILQCHNCSRQFDSSSYPNCRLNCPMCGQTTGATTGDSPILKDNGKFMITDSLKVFESSMVKAMELIQEKANGFRDIKTSSATLTEETVKKLIFHSLLGSRTVLTDLFTDCRVTKAKSESDESAGSFELFGQ